MRFFFTRNRLWTVCKWCLLIVMLDSLKASFFWNLPIKFIIPLLFIIIIILIPEMFSFNKKTSFIIMLLYLITVFWGRKGNINAYISTFIGAGGVLFFLGLKDIYKKEFLVFFTRFFSILVGISLFGWILFLLGVHLPSFYDTYGFSESRNEAQYIFQNYYIFLFWENKVNLIDSVIPRFSSVFLEPGYFGIILVILLYLNNFNFKKKSNIILLIALAFTFSLASWLLAIFTYIAYYLRFSKKKFTTLLSITFFLWVFYAFFSSYNNGENVINQLILQRIEYDDSKGSIAGYNRTKEDFEDWFTTSFITSSNVFLGIDMYKIFGQTTNVGWKVYMVNYGVIGVLFYILFLFYSYYKHKNYQCFIFFILYILIFMRGHHIIYWSAFPILYLGGCVILKDNAEAIINLNK